MDNTTDDGPEAKRVKLETTLNGTGEGKEEERMTITATQLFEGMLSNIADGSKKETLNSFIQTLCKLRDKVDDPLNEQKHLKDDEVVVVDEGITNPIVLPECPQPPSSSHVKPLQHSQTNGNAVSSPGKRGTKLFIKSPTPSLSKMPVLEAIPPLAPGIALRPPQADLLLRQQAQLKATDRLRFLNPSSVAPAEESTLMQKERAHQRAMQATTTSTAGMPDNSAAYILRLKQRILQTIHESHEGKASDEQIQQYLKRPFFMILENNSYTTYPNPWSATQATMQDFMTGHTQQRSHPMPVMLPPRPPAAHPRQMTNLLAPQWAGGMLPPTGAWPSQGSAFHQPSASPQSHLNTLQFPLQQGSSLFTATKGLSLPVIDMRPRQNDWSVRGIPLPTCLHIQCNCFPEMNPLAPYLPKK